MSNKSIMTASSFNTRRKIIIVLVITILLLGIVSGFANPFITDNTVHTAGYGETIVMEEAPPENGSPSDYDALSNLKYAAYRIHHASSFRGETQGIAVADIGFTTYSQYLTNTRVVINESKIFTETISSSSLKNLGEQKYIEDNVVIFRPSTKVKNGVATFSDTAYQMSFENFSSSYGAVPNQLSKHIINEATILSVVDENAPTIAEAKNAQRPVYAESDEVATYYVPETLVKNENGHYIFTVTLDPVEASKYYRNEVKTLGGADELPVFYAVTVTFEIDENWYPVSVTTIENYDIAIPVLGAMNCTGTNVEVFSEINGVTEMPEYDFYKPYIDNAKNDPNYVPPAPPPSAITSPADYLSAAFADYLTGEKNLVLTADVTAGATSVYGLNLSADLNSFDIQAMLGDLCVKYSKAEDRVYIRLNDLNGYLSTTDFAELMKNERMSALFGGMASIDFASILGDDILATVFDNCELTIDNGVACIYIPFTLDTADLLGKVDIAASIYIDDETKALKSIAAEISVNGTDIVITAQPPRRTPSFLSTDGAVDISGVLDFIPDIISTLQQKTLAVSGSVAAFGYDIGISAYIDRTNGIKVDAVLSALGLDFSVKYVDGTLYVGIGDIDVRGTLADLPELFNAITALTGGGSDLDKYASLIKRLLPTTVNDFISMVKSLEVTDDTLDLGLSILTVPVEIKLTRNNGMLDGLYLGMNVDMLGFKFDAAVDLGIAAVATRDVTVPDGDNYITFDELAALMQTLAPYLDENNSFEIELSARIDGYNIGANVAIDDLRSNIKASGTITALGANADLVYADGIAYIALGNVKLKLDTTKLDTLIPAIARITELFGTSVDGERTVSVTDILGCIGGIATDDNGALVLHLSLLDNELTVTLDAAAGTIEIVSNDGAFDISAQVSTTTNKHDITAPADGDEYIDITDFSDTLEKLADILEQKSLAFDLGLKINDITLAANIELSFEDGLKLRATVNKYGLDITVIGTAAYIVCGDIRVAGSVDDIPALLELLRDYIPADIAETIAAAISGNGMPEFAVSDISDVLSMIKRLTVNNGILNADVNFNGNVISLEAATDLSNMSIEASISGLTVSAVFDRITVRPIDISVSGAYVPLQTLIDAAKPILPLVSAQGFNFGVDVKVLGVTVSGNVYIFMGGASEPFMLDADLNIADLPVRLTVKDGTVYLSVNNTVSVKQELSEAALLDIIEKLEYVIPGIKDKITELTSNTDTISLDRLIACVALSPAESGFDLVLDMNKLGKDILVAASVTTEQGTLDTIALNCNISGFELNTTLDCTIENGVLTAIADDDGSDDDVIGSLAVTIATTGYKLISLDESKYIRVSALTEFIAPVYDLIGACKTAKTVTLGIDASLLTPDNASTTITGSITVSLDPIAVNASITLFAGTDTATEISVIYAGTTVYVRVGNIALSLDTATDFERLYYILADYLPDYINDEIAKLLGLKSGTSAFSDVSLMLDRFEQIANAADGAELVRLLFAPLGAIKSDSVVKTALDMVTLFERDGALTIGLNMFGVTLNATPWLDNGSIVGATVSTTLMGYALKIDLNGFAVYDTAVEIDAPADASEYVSVIDFIEAIDSAVKTFTATDVNGDITFELESFDFDYYIYAVETTTDEFGNTVNVKDDAGRDKPLVDEKGNKVVDQTVKVYNKAGYSALKGKFIKDEKLDEDGNVISTSYKFNLEAHVVLEISSLKNSTPLTLDLYVINNNDHNGIAFLDYMEGNGNGERISIDYDSIMQIVAAALDIMSVDDEIVDMLFGDYRLDIDKTVFESMDIAGLDSIKDMLTNLVYAVQDIKDGIEQAKAGWNLIATAGSIEVLGERLDEVKADFEKAIEIVKAVISSFGSKSNEQPAETPDETTEFNGKLFNDIVNGVTLKKTDTEIIATIENSIATGTDGVSSVKVTQSGKTIKSVEVQGLDVNTAKLDNFDAQFTAGSDVQISLPDNYNVSTASSTYSDFSNVKYLLFDVMNTANLFEFEIGDATAATNSNKISLNMSLIGLNAISVDIMYNVKVQIIDQGEGAEPRFKTAAIAELVFKNCTALGATLIPNCTTRLYFYDNMLYVRGLEWYQYVETGIFGIKTTKWGTRDISIAYSLDDLATMLASDSGMEDLMYKFVFYLLPLSRNFTVIGYDLQNKIASSVTSSDGADPTPTIATVFKGYTYSDGAHGLTIGLSELAEAPGSNMLGDLNVTLAGKNDGDGNILDNYIGNASIALSLINSSACTLNIKILAELRNVEVYTDTDGVQKIRSTGLTATTDGYTLDGIISNVIPDTSWQRLYN